MTRALSHCEPGWARRRCASLSALVFCVLLLVSVAPAFAEGYTATEAAQAYANGVNNVGAGYQGYGGSTAGGLGGIGVGGTLR